MFSDDLQRVVALVVAWGLAVYAFAPALFGLLRAMDATWMFGAAAAVQLLAIGCFLGGGRRSGWYA